MKSATKQLQQQPPPPPMCDSVLEELGVDFIGQFERESARRIRDFQAEYQLQELPTWLRVGLEVAGVSTFQKQAQKCARDGKGRRAEGSFRALFKPFTWASAVRCFYLYCTTKLLVICGLQYCYDLHKLAYENLKKLDRQQQHQQQDGLGQTTDSLERIEQAIELDRRLIELIGGPYIEFSFITEASCLCIAWTAFMAYVLPQIYFASRGLETFGLLTSMVNWPGEQKFQDKWILKEVNNFVASSGQFLRSKLRDSLQQEKRSRGLSQTTTGSAQQTLFQAHQSHRLAIEQLKEMALSGQLQPLNRSPGWMRRVWSWYDTIGRSLLIYQYLFSLAILVLPIYFDLFKKIRTGPRDLLVILETVVFSWIMIISSAVYLPLVCLTSVDYIHLIIELRKEIDRYISLNSRAKCQQQHAHHLDPLETGMYWPMADDVGRRNRERHPTTATTPTTATSGTSAVAAAALEQAHAAQTGAHHLLLLFMHYKIFVGRLKEFQRVFGIVMICVVQVNAINSIILLTHTSPIEGGMSWSLPFCIICVAAGELCLAPLCYMHCRCQQLHTSLFSLYAHLARVQHDESSTAAAGAQSGDAAFHNPHLVALIRKELGKSDLRLAQFAPVAFGFPLTYSNFLRFHFWFGLLVISALLTTSNSRTSRIKRILQLDNRGEH